MAEDSDDKTEQPTSKRLDEARGEGNVPQSAEAKILASMIGALIIIGILAPKMANDLSRLLLPFVEQPHAIAVDAEGLRALLLHTGLGLIGVLAWPMLLIIVLALAVSLAQTKGLLWVPKKLMPDFSKLSPMQGISRMFSGAQLVELVKALLKLVIMGTALTWLTLPHLREYQGLADLELGTVMGYISDQVYTLVLTTLFMILVLWLGDYLFQRWRFMERMKMSKQEVKDENKQQEGDPQVKAKIRSLRVRRARQRMMAAVPTADVIVTNPTHFAVALKYDMETMNAPMLVAKGADHIAFKIRERAQEHEVPIVENPPLARALYASVELDQEVPPEHYKAVAEIIGYVMRLKGKLAN
ncbi:MAG: flagellar biosynthesis protein FlhB [Solirubrobacterales bacterium]